MKFLFLFVIAFAITLSSIGQSKFVAVSQPTTEEEYNYVTKGYPTQISEGLDMKKGYSFKDLGIIKDGNYEYNLKALIREATNEIATELVIVKDIFWNRVYYIGIPHGNTALTQRYSESIGSWDIRLTRSYSLLLSTAWGATFANMYEHDREARK